MKVKELIELLKQYDPEMDVAIEFTVIDEFGSWCGPEYIVIDYADCTTRKDLFVINMEDYKHI